MPALECSVSPLIAGLSRGLEGSKALGRAVHHFASTVKRRAAISREAKGSKMEIREWRMACGGLLVVASGERPTRGTDCKWLQTAATCSHKQAKNRLTNRGGAQVAAGIECLFAEASLEGRRVAASASLLP